MNNAATMKTATETTAKNGRKTNQTKLSTEMEIQMINLLICTIIGLMIGILGYIVAQEKEK